MKEKEQKGDLYQETNRGLDNNHPDALEQELTDKVNELETQRKERESCMVDITLEAISRKVTSRKEDIIRVMSKKPWQQSLRELIVSELIRVADGRLWCTEYNEKARSQQRMLVYTGSHWEPVAPQQWMDFVKLCAERCGVDVSQLMDYVFMKSLYEAVAYNLASYRKCTVPDGEVWVNLLNGTLVVKSDGSVGLREHRKEDLFSYTLQYVYHQEADCPQWHRFLNRVLPESEAQQVLAEFIGYCLMRHHRLEKMLWLYGSGQNGKSVTLELVEALLGAMNVSYLSLTDLTNDDVKRAGFEGKLLNISTESGRDVNPNVLKQLTSGERVSVKRLYVDPRETDNYGKVLAAFNDLPRAENTFGYFRRLMILPYQVTIPSGEVDRRLADKLKQELSGILNWVLAALPRLMQTGEFTHSESCDRALERYRLLSDNVLLFAQERCEQYEYTTTGQDIYNAYRNYCAESSLKASGKQKFYERLASVYPREDSGNVTRFKLKLIES